MFHLAVTSRQPHDQSGRREEEYRSLDEALLRIMPDRVPQSKGRLMSVGPLELLLILTCCGITFGVPTMVLVAVLLRRSRGRTGEAETEPDSTSDPLAEN